MANAIVRGGVKLGATEIAIAPAEENQRDVLQWLVDSKPVTPPFMIPGPYREVVFEHFLKSAYYPCGLAFLPKGQPWRGFFEATYQGVLRRVYVRLHEEEGRRRARLLLLLDRDQRFFNAVRLSDLPAMEQAFSEGQDINVEDSEGRTPLKEAADFRQADAAALLLARGGRMEGGFRVLPKANASSWKTKPFVQGSPLPLSLSLTEVEMRFAEAGHIPEGMEDKWFIYYEEPFLFFHRSWTGYPVYRVKFSRTESGFEAREALWNAPPEKDTDKDRSWAAGLLDVLLANHLLGKRKPLP